nr:MAG TPA: hypothetical protein [Caudoviricetes sp.]
MVHRGDVPYRLIFTFSAETALAWLPWENKKKNSETGYPLSNF